MDNAYTYWQNTDTPFFVVRQASFSSFEYYDRKTHEWKEYADGFREISLSHECHTIPAPEAARIVQLLRSTNTVGMSYKELCELILR